MAHYLGGLLLLVVALSANADPFSGEFAGAHEGSEVLLSLKQSADGRYAGSMRVDGRVIAVVATRRGNELTGQIREQGEIYQFVTVVDGQRLLFKFDDGDTIAFQPIDAAVSHAARSAANAPTSIATPNGAGQRAVYINRMKLTPAQLQALETTYQTRIENGRYWYDAVCGAWGVEGGPTAGFILAGLDLPKPLPPDISGGGTGIFINGREIHVLDQKGLQQLFGVAYRGRYWLDAQGNLGLEGGPAIVNIVAAIQAAQRQQSVSQSGSVTHGYNSAYGARGTVGGGMYSGRTASGKSVFWYPGM